MTDYKNKNYNVINLSKEAGEIGAVNYIAKTNSKTKTISNLR